MAPPSVSSVSFRTSVATTTCARTGATAGLAPGTAFMPAGMAAVGTPETPVAEVAALGTDASDADATGAAAVLAGAGKNVAFCPLKTCH